MIFLTGGLGYIGSHVAAQLAKEDHTELIILDNLCNSNISVLHDLKNMHPTTVFHFYEGDVRDADVLTRIFDAHTITTVIHLAAMKSVKESFAKRAEYESVNVGGTKTLLEVMEAKGCNRIVFSSSATVYGQAVPPLYETTQTGVGIANPYGETKWIVEEILKTCAPNIQSVILRYFNPVGAHVTHRLGEAPNGIPNNLLPVLLRSLKTKEPLTVFGTDWPTRDGTCIRDYIDIQDLATAHTAAVERFDSLVATENPWVCNVGTGKGTTVLELFATFEDATGVPVSYVIGERREGDLSEVVAAISSTRMAQLEWKPVHSLEESCRNAWSFLEKN